MVFPSKERVGFLFPTLLHPGLSSFFVESYTALKLYIWWYVNLLDDLHDSDVWSRVEFELHIPARHPTFI